MWTRECGGRHECALHGFPPWRAAQIAGFAVVFALFLACGLAITPLTASAGGLGGFQALYYVSSFFAQFVNATTFLLVRCTFTHACCQS